VRTANRGARGEGELLPLKNESWLDEGEVEVSANEFKPKVKFESVTVIPDGSFDFWPLDSHLFRGHSIQVSSNPSVGSTHADIPGQGCINRR
jgi:hypothetical protein